ncbi:hypothetical protein GCM10008111_18300 [Alishewanella tabrizica]|uniref:Polysaccharide biosynthesis protein n=2 Tax=Alishewanella tabrizica TaxID=671278 RepID=A0ABQ2WQ66_9ALTE|nr:hypothetical protein GCM10008111_18300 [Alishewanella tabrizica]
MFGKLIVRSLGIISTLILVRLLDPKDFGIVAIGILIIGFFEVLSNAGVNRYLILQPSPSDDDYNAAWTINIFLRTVLNIILILLASSAARLFENPELETVIYIMCLTEFFYSFRNIGMVKLEKELNYQKENKVLILAKILSFCACLTAAYYFRNYYALLIGNIVNVIISIIGSYMVVSYRPKFNFKFQAEMFSYSKFLLFRNIVSYIRSQMDILLVGKRFGDVATGQFSVARQFSAMPQSELVSPAMQPIFSGLAKFKSEPAKLMANSIQVLQLGYLFLAPCALGLLAVAEPFTLVVLGEKWLPVKDFIGVLALLMIIFITQSVITTLYDANNKIKYSMFGDFAGIVLLATGFIYYSVNSVTEFAYLRVFVGAINFCFIIYFAKIFVELPVKKVLEVLMLPLSLSLAMYYFLMLLKPYFYSYPSAVELFLTVFFGFTIYVLLLLLFSILIRIFIKGGEFNLLIDSLPISVLKRLK